MTPEERIRGKVAGLKKAQVQRQSDALRREYDITVGLGNEAYEMNTPREINPSLSGRNRGREVKPDFKYSDEVLQAAMDASNSNSNISNDIFYKTLQATGNPDLATAAVNAAGYTPGVGTAIGMEEAYRAARDIPGSYQQGNYGDVARGAGVTAMGVLDAALTMAPFAKAAVKGARNLPKALSRAGDVAMDGMQAADRMMAPRPTQVNQQPMLEEVLQYLQARGR